MTSREFETNRAKYKQIFAVHTMPLNDKIFKLENFSSIDAVVLEAYHGKRWFDLLWASPLKANHKELFDAVQKTGKPVYVTDVLTTSGGRATETLGNTAFYLIGLFGFADGAQKIIKQAKEKKPMNRRTFLKFWGVQGAKTFGGAFLFSDWVCRNYVLSTGNTPKFVANLTSWRMRLFPTPQFELRNAITAKKVEEFVAPELEKSLGRKPNILLVYGAGHSGLKDNLQHPGIRNSVLGLYRAINYAGVDAEYLDKVTNLKIDEKGSYILSERKIGLFR